MYSQISDHYGIGMDIQVELRAQEAAYVADWAWENQRRRTTRKHNLDHNLNPNPDVDLRYRMLLGSFGGGHLFSSDRKNFCCLDEVDEVNEPEDD